ncbi:PAS domain-containing sensor histidine kinase [Sphingobacterium thalpophilum]|uniref:PAS domain-containing sensor histidine kinase n=1 Tax=Sphingobacterium thalpophilum TaxID=259 RepID=UPI0024A6715B|nr:HAMP domain-containing sensor histidine kinase [Sphingobacterium thalpophilum]
MLFWFDSDDMSRANDLAKLNIKHFLESCKPEIIKAMEENTACEYIYQCIAPDGRSRWLRLNGRGVENEHSEMSIFYGLIIDITKQKLDEQQKLDFLNVSGHELKTPLTSLVGFLKILELKLQQQNIPDFKVILKKALEQSDRLKMLIGNFLELVKLETENMELNLRQVTVMDLISNFRSITANMVRDKISFDVNVGNESICCDCKKIGMVFLEIIRNAIKFSPVSGLIHVQVSVNEELLKISIRDNGEGIAKAETGLIFEKFYRGHRNKKDYISGFGIGLYLAKNIVDMHGGSIGVESERGSGSLFWFTIPFKLFSGE